MSFHELSADVVDMAQLVTGLADDLPSDDQQLAALGAWPWVTWWEPKGAGRQMELPVTETDSANERPPVQITGHAGVPVAPLVGHNRVTIPRALVRGRVAWPTRSDRRGPARLLRRRGADVRGVLTGRGARQRAVLSV